MAKTSLEDLLSMMDAMGVRKPDPSRPRQVKRALRELRDLLLVEYKHTASLGDLPAHVRRTPAAEAVKQYRLAMLARLARPNGNRQLRLRRYGARANSSSPESDRSLSGDALRQAMEFMESGEVGPALAARLKELRDRGAFKRQDLDADIIATLFPPEGKLKQPDTWAPEARVSESLSRYALVSRAGELPPPPDVAEPFSDKEAIAYIIDAAGVSLAEAKAVLREMKRSAERKGRSGGRRAMQASSAMCALGRVRKLSAYRPPRDLVDKAGLNAVVILMSPPGTQPRVMTWRHGTHIDCDFVGTTQGDMLRILGQAIQSSLYWLAERPKRAVKTKIYVGRVGEGALRLVWAPGSPVSLAVVSTNLQKGPVLTYSSGARDLGNYARAVKTQGGRPTPARSPRTRPARTTTATPSVPVQMPGTPPDDLFAPVEEEASPETFLDLAALLSEGA